MKKKLVFVQVLTCSFVEVPRYVEKVLNTQPGELCYMVGTIYLQMNKKPNVLNDLEDEVIKNKSVDQKCIYVLL